MTTRRRLLMFGLLAGLLMLGVRGWVLWPRTTTAITRESAARIQENMTLAEVEAILGGPEREETTGPLEELGAGDPVGNRDAIVLRTWRSDFVYILVGFDEDHCVASRSIFYTRRAPESLLDMLRRWLRP
jgi:hypothetical protein